MLEFKEALEQLTTGIKEWTNKKVVNSNSKSIMLKTHQTLDINELIEPGYYYISSANSYLHCPIQAGLLIVLNDSSQSVFERHYQIAIDYKVNSIYMRTVKVHGEFQSWLQLYEKKDTQGPSSTILESCDINTVDTMGAYNISSTYSYSNLPSRNIAGLLIVFNNLYNKQLYTQLYQIFIGYKSGNFYIRNRISETEFTEWINLRIDKTIIDAKANKDDVLTKTEYLDFIGGNMFDGNYIEGYQLATPNPPGQPFFNKNDDFNSLAIFTVKPNTTYSIVIEDPQLEPMNEFDAETQSFYYFKVYTATRLLEPGEAFDGAVAKIRTRTKTEYYEITTGENDAVCYVQTAKKLQPFMQFIEGSYDKYVKSEYGTASYQLNGKLKLSKAHIEQVLDAMDDTIIDEVVDTLNTETIPVLKEDIKTEVGQELQVAIDEAAAEQKTYTDDAISSSLPYPVNLFDGSYMSGYTLTGSAAGSYKLAKSIIFNSLAIVPVKPSTTYTIIREYAIKEHPNATNTTQSYFYGKFATSKEQVDLSTVTNNGISLSDDTYTSAQKQLNNTLLFTITTDEKTTCLYIQVGREITPGLMVIEGEYTENPYGVFYNIYNSNTQDNKKLISFTQESLDEYLKNYINSNIANSIATNKSFVLSKTATDITISKGRVKYILTKVTSTSKNMNSVWRWMKLYIGDSLIFDGADCEGVLLEKGAGDHIGGCHGNEIATSFELYVNYEPIEEDAIIDNMVCDHICLVAHSNIYSYLSGGYSTTRHLFNRIKKLEWKQDSLDIYNTWKYVDTAPSTLQSVKLSGMASVQNDTLSGYVNYLVDTSGQDVYTTGINSQYTPLKEFTYTNYTAGLDHIKFIGRNNYSLDISTTDSTVSTYKGKVLGYDYDVNNLNVGRLKAYFESMYDQGNSGEGYVIDSSSKPLRGHFTITINQFADERVGDINSALDGILAIQDSLLGGEVE